ncbi:hypothetical protein CYANOKiyG1_65950 [Okeania sp. KiyG1]|nr:hypothetical protein CYANOKiyG1_65950 [Okeania sp. KiyG1]
MNKKSAHTMIPQANHDELARQNFVKSFRNYLFGKMRNDLKLVYQETVKPQFEKENQRPLKIVMKFGGKCSNNHLISGTVAANVLPKK